MPGVRLQCDRPVAFTGLDQDARNTQVDKRRYCGHSQTKAQLLNRLRIDQAWDGSESDAAGCNQDHAAFKAAREKLDFRVSVTEFVIGRPGSNRERYQCNNGCHKVDEGFDRIREQADRVGQPECTQLKAYGDKRCQDGKPGETRQIAAINRAHGILLYREDAFFPKDPGAHEGTGCAKAIALTYQIRYDASMEFRHLMDLVGDDPIFETSLLFAGKANPDIVRLQLTRWKKSGRVYQLRRGLYALAPPYQKVKPHPFLIANRLQRASYVSVQTALAFYQLIPETVYITMSVTAGRPERLETPLGIFEFKHIKSELLRGYHMTDLGNQQALVAKPEKALLDLVYLQPGGDRLEYLRELRLQNLSQLNIAELRSQAEVFDAPKMRRAVRNLSRLAQSDTEEYESL
jgi:predicted transcriptional regulator of viral defense system